MTINKDDTILKEGDPVGFLIIVKEGELELFKEIDGVPFILERLGRGAAINYRNFYFYQEDMQYNIRASSRAKILILSIKKLDKLQNEYPKLERQFILAMNTIVKKDKKFPLDYKFAHPKASHTKSFYER